ncbi:MAG: hypothetical protein ACI92I_000397 [Acidimicrobiales bacterium]|jgi:hypothetical protein
MKKLWTPKRIKEGFEKFIALHQRLPTAGEVDTFQYLPSSRYIQKRFGGLEFLRYELGYTDVHLGKGDFRSKIATKVGERGRQLEADLELELQTLFTDICVHTEKTFCGKKRIDFYIHTQEGNFGIDIFYAETMRTLQSSVNIKMKRYQEFKEPLYLTVANKDFRQTELDTYAKNKKYPLPSNVTLINLKTLRENLKNMVTHTELPIIVFSVFSQKHITYPRSTE